MRTQTSAIERLQSLPPIFRGTDLTVRNEWTSKTASQYLYLWSRRRLIMPLGGKSDVFANLLTNKDPNWEEALIKAMPSATVCGLEALRRAGWITQIPTLPTVVVNKDVPNHKVKHFAITHKTSAWFKRVQPGILASEAPGIALPCMHPAWALADLAATYGLGIAAGVWPDDLDAEAVTDDNVKQWRQACRALSLNEAALFSQWPELRLILKA
jgi:hypothetical protein